MGCASRHNQDNLKVEFPSLRRGSDFRVTYRLVNMPQTLERGSHVINRTLEQANVIALPEMAPLATYERQKIILP